MEVRSFRSDIFSAPTRNFFLDAHRRGQDAISEFLAKIGSGESPNSLKFFSAYHLVLARILTLKLLLCLLNYF